MAKGTTKKPLTERQAQIYSLLDGGMTPAEVAEELATSPTNIYGHMRKIKDKGWRIPRATRRRTRSGRKSRATARTNGQPNGAARHDGPPAHIRKAVEAVKLAIEIEREQAEKRQERIRALKDELETEETQAAAIVAEMERLRKAEEDLVVPA